MGQGRHRGGAAGPPNTLGAMLLGLCHDKSRTSECSSRPAKRSLAAPCFAAPQARVGCQTSPPSTSPLSPSRVMEMRDVSKSPLRHHVAYSVARRARIQVSIENFASVIQNYGEVVAAGGVFSLLLLLPGAGVLFLLLYLFAVAVGEGVVFLLLLLRGWGGGGVFSFVAVAAGVFAFAVASQICKPDVRMHHGFCAAYSAAPPHLQTQCLYHGSGKLETAR